MGNFAVRGFAAIGVLSLLILSFQNCAKSNQISPLDMSSAVADGPCWNSSSGSLIESCGLSVGIGTSAPNAKLQVSGGPTILQQEPWTDVTFQNSWVNYGGSYAPTGFFKDSNGVVHLRGLTMNGTVNACIFTLPAGYRPGYRAIFNQRYYLTNIGEGAIRVDIQNTGCVSSVGATSAIAWLSLEGITFLAEQ